MYIAYSLTWHENISPSHIIYDSEYFLLYFSLNRIFYQDIGANSLVRKLSKLKMSRLLSIDSVVLDAKNSLKLDKSHKNRCYLTK